MSDAAIEHPGPRAFPALVSVRAISDALLERIRARVPDPAILDEHPPFTWTAQISNNNLDAYYTRMRVSSLTNYANDAEAGVSFQDSHRTDGMERTLGHSIAGRYTGPGGNGIAHADADFYTLTGLDSAIDSFVRRVRGGLARDVSIGFYDGQYICSICNRDMLRDWSCWHIPGFEYVVTDEQGNKTSEKVLATADIENARLSEVSTVYDGATPGAAILKAQREADAGRLRHEQARLLEARYRIKLPGTGMVVPGTDLPKEERMDPQPDQTPDPQRLIVPDAIRALFTRGGVQADDLESGVRALVTEIERLRPKAADGETYRATTIEEALAEGTRAMGAAFAREVYAGMLATLDLAVITRMRDDWREIGDARFAGGRQTEDAGDDPPPTRAHETPDAAYAA
jgi:hypothetical protein